MPEHQTICLGGLNCPSDPNTAALQNAESITFRSLSFDRWAQADFPNPSPADFVTSVCGLHHRRTTMPRFTILSIALATFALTTTDAKDAQAQCSGTYVRSVPVTRVYRSPSVSCSPVVRSYSSAPVRVSTPVAVASRPSVTYTARRPSYTPQPIRIQQPVRVQQPIRVQQPVRIQQPINFQQPVRTQFAAPVARPIQQTAPSLNPRSASSLLSRPSCANGQCGF